MADIQRDLVKLLEDLDRRARPGRPSRYRAIQKFSNLSDTVYFSSDTVTGTNNEAPYVWYGASTPSSCGLSWSLGTWS